MRWTRLLAAALALAALPTTASARDSWQRTFRAGDHPRVVVSASDARVSVHARPGASVDARITTTGRTVGLYIGSRKPEVALEQRGETISITARSGGTQSLDGITISWETLVVEVDVPPGCDLEIENSDGSVSVSGIEGHVAVRSSDARVTLHDLKGDVSVRTSDGPVVADGLDGRLEGSTSDGTMRISGRFDELDLDSSDGSLTVDVRPGSRIVQTWNITTSDGGLDLGLPEEFQATLDARVRDGGLRLDLPDVQLGRSNPSSVRLDLNGGGPVLRVRSGDGSVRIRTRS